MRYVCLPTVLMFLCLPNLARGQETSHSLMDVQQQLESQQQEIRRLQERLSDQSAAIREISEERFPSEEQTPREAFESGSLPSASTCDDHSSDFMAALSDLSKRMVSGRIHIDQWMHPQGSRGINIIETGDPNEDPENQLLYRRIRLGVAGDIPPGNMSYRLEIEYSGQDGSQFRDAWIGWDDLVFFQTLRLGNQKRPYGWDQLNSSNYMIFLERPLIDDALNQNNRRFGLMSYGVSDNQAFNWNYGVFYLPLVQNVGEITGDHFQPEFAGRVANTWWYDEANDGRNYGHAGLAGTLAIPDGDAPNNGSQNNEAIFQTRPEGRSESFWLNTGRIAGAETFEIACLESVLNWGSVQLGGEFMNLWVQREQRNGDGLSFHGGYVYASYFLTGEHIPWDRRNGVLGRVVPHRNFFHPKASQDGSRFGWGAWQAAVRLSYADLTDQDILGGDGKSTTLALNWYWNSHSRLQFNYLFGHIDDRLAALRGGGREIVSGDYQITGIRCMIDF